MNACKCEFCKHFVLYVVVRVNDWLSRLEQINNNKVQLIRDLTSNETQQNK